MLSQAQDIEMRMTREEIMAESTGEPTYRMMVEFPNDSRGPRESKSLSFDAAYKVIETLETTDHRHSYKSIVIYSETTGEAIYPRNKQEEGN